MTVLERFQKIKLFVFDVDGVLTDGSLYVFNDGEQARKMNIKDGFALQLAVKKGYGMLVISGAYSEAVQKRLEKLGITDVLMKVTDKRETMLRYLEEKKISAEHVLFMGDDIPDYEVRKQVGIASCPADAAPEIKSISQYISIYKGGEGCARDVIEKVMKVRGDWSIDVSVSSK